MSDVMRRTQDLSANEAALDQLAKLTGAQDGRSQVSHHHHHSKIKGKWAQCGGWQPEYTNLHRSISSGMDERSRAFISKSPNSGLADRMVGILTGFYAALLSKRAFFLSDWWTWGSTHVRLTDAFEWQHINMTLPWKWEQEIQSNNRSYVMLDYLNAEAGLFSPKGDPNKTAEHLSVVLSTALNATRIVLETNRGNVYNLLKRPPAKLKDAVAQLGITSPEYGVYCAFHYLFKPRQETLELLRGPHIGALHDPHIIKIGIHIRTGDHGFSFPDRINVDSDPYYGLFFTCATDLEKRILSATAPPTPPFPTHSPPASSSSSVSPSSPTKIVWYLISDSMTLKEDASKKFGDKLQWSNVQPMHIGIANDVNDIKRKGPQAMRAVAADVLGLAMCDYFILSHDSGLGKLAALLSHTAHEGRVFVAAPGQNCKALSDADMATSNQGARL